MRNAKRSKSKANIERAHFILQPLSGPHGMSAAPRRYSSYGRNGERANGILGRFGRFRADFHCQSTDKISVNRSIAPESAGNHGRGRKVIEDQEGGHRRKRWRSWEKGGGHRRIKVIDGSSN